MTCDEIRSFENGAPNQRKESLNIYEIAQTLAYDKDHFEIKFESLDFINSVMLGCGEYGCVYKASLLCKMEGNQESVEVAVKTADSELNDVSKFLILLAEAKLMTFLGKHENVVELIGICTEEIQKSRVLSFLCFE